MPGTCPAEPATIQVAPSSAGESAPAAVLHIALEAAAGADAGHGRRLDHQREGLADGEHLLAQIAEDALRRQALLLALLRSR